MDALEDRDIQLHRASSDLLQELETSLPCFLWSTKDLDTQPQRRLRTLVRCSTTADLIKLVSYIHFFLNFLRKGNLTVGWLMDTITYS